MSGVLGGVPVLVSPALPVIPSPGEDARRIVRHGMADVLAWLGEDVGPKPGAAAHVVMGLDGGLTGSLVAMVSREMYDRLREEQA